MINTVKLKRGLDLRMEGAVEAGAPVQAVSPDTVAVCPDDFHGFLPKLQVKRTTQWRRDSL